MKIFGMQIGGAEKRSIENPTVPVSADAFMQFFGVESGTLATPTVERALQVPAFLCAVNFLSASLANLPLHAYRSNADGSERVKGGLQTILTEAPNSEWSSFGARKYFWQQVFTGGRGILLIERNMAGNVLGLWPVDPGDLTVRMQSGRRIYKISGVDYPASEVVDIPFMLKRNQTAAYSPLVLASKALQLALAMNDYASGFFAGGGVPPLALTGPMPTGADAMKRAMADISRAIDTAKKSDKPLFPLPPGYTLSPVGFDPEKGQMTDGRRFQIEEIARIFSIPPVFLQDLTRATFTNAEHQDLHLVKHLIAQWAKALEDEMNLKLFGQSKKGRYVEHSLDGLMRGDFVSRMAGLSQAIQNGLLTPNEGRDLENRPALLNGDVLLIQGATVPLGSQAMNAPIGGDT
jgi:HK97 family phage portal protein